MQKTTSMGFALFLALSACLFGCANRYSEVSGDEVVIPSEWQTSIHSGKAAWSDFIQAPELESLLVSALNNNLALQREYHDVEIARNSLSQKRLQFWPSLDFRFNGSRSGVEDVAGSTSNSLSLSSQLTYELNVWGQLSDEKKAAAFGFSLAKAEYDSFYRALVNNVTNAWLNVAETSQLVALRTKRLSTLEKNLAIIDSGYRSGLNTALEVYLTRNDVEGERSRLLQQQQALSDSQRELTLFLGRYPDKNSAVVREFPDTGDISSMAVPSEILKTRPDLQAAWFAVLQQNSLLAIAHKDRFPSLTITASASKSAQEVSAVGGSNIVWNLGASLIQPILNAGRLKMAESNARLQLQKAEKKYLETVYSAFSEVESALENQEKLALQLQFIKAAAENAVQAEALSFEQYRRGIVPYSTVLEAQRRNLDAQIQLISLNKQIIANKVFLLNAINGELDFLPAKYTEAWE